MARADPPRWSGRAAVVAARSQTHVSGSAANPTRLAGQLLQAQLRLAFGRHGIGRRGFQVCPGLVQLVPNLRQAKEGASGGRGGAGCQRWCVPAVRPRHAQQPWGRCKVSCSSACTHKPGVHAKTRTRAPTTSVLPRPRYRQLAHPSCGTPATHPPPTCFFSSGSALCTRCICTWASWSTSAGIPRRSYSSGPAESLGGVGVGWGGPQSPEVSAQLPVCLVVIRELDEAALVFMGK